MRKTDGFKNLEEFVLFFYAVKANMLTQNMHDTREKMGDHFKLEYVNVNF